MDLLFAADAPYRLTGPQVAVLAGLLSRLPGVDAAE
jgi:hypothetical protein